MRAPMIPGRKPEDDGHREAMLRRLGIAEEKPPAASRWDAIVRDLGPAPPVQTLPPMEPAAEEPTVEERQPILMTEAPRMAETPVHEPVALEPVEPIRAEPAAPPRATPEPPAPEPYLEQAASSASFMPGWGEESIPEEEEADVEAFAEPEEPLEAEPELEPEPDVEAVSSEPEALIEEPEAPSAEVIFIEHALAGAAVEEEPAEEAEAVGEVEVETPPLVQALEQIRADLEVICQYVEGAPSSEVAQATPLAAELLQLGAVLLHRSQTA